MITTLDIPQGWQKLRLKRIANLNPSKGEVTNLPDDTVVTFLPMEAVGESWEVDYSRTRPLAEVRNGYTYFRDGDILVAKITPCFENGKGALVNGCLNRFGFGTTEFHVIRSPNLETTRFLSYVVRSYRFKVEGAGMMTGTAGQKRLSDDYVKDFEVFLPPMLEREKIARFLDRKTAAIDTLIAKKQRLIQLLEEKRTALINQAVTKGLNPNAPMKDSGIPWIGEIPEHWGIVALGYICSLTSGGTPDRNRPEFWNGDIPWVKTGEINYNYIHQTEEYITELGLKNSSTKLASKGTLLMAMYGQGLTRGRVAILDIEASFNQACLAIYPHQLIEIQYLYYYFVNAYQHIRDDGNETSQMNLSSGLIGKIKITLPTIEEQRTIASFLDGKVEYIDSLKQKLKNSIEKLQEYRRSLITAAVTGKLDINTLEQEI